MGTVAAKAGADNELSGEALMRHVLDRLSIHGWHAKAICPCHPDVEPSLTITVKRLRPELPLTAVFYCPACNANGDDVAAALGVPRYRLFYGDFPSFGQKPPQYIAPLPAPSVVRDRVEALTGAPARDFFQWRGINRAMRRRYGVGWNEEEQRYELPIRASKGGPLVSLKWCYLRYEGQETRGLRILSGHKIHLYPYPPQSGARAPNWIVLTEGEWDCLRARQVGLPAYTAGGAYTWSESWSPMFRGKRVTIVYDCDEAGRAGAQRVARFLEPYALSVYVADLNPRRRDGWDLSKFLSKYSVDQLKVRIGTTLREDEGSGKVSEA